MSIGTYLRKPVAAGAIAMAMACAPAYAAEVGSGPLYSVIELEFTGPNRTPSDAPAKNDTLWAEFRHESGTPTYRIHGFWDGNGSGGSSGNIWKIRFCPTKTGRWNIIDVESNRSLLNNQKEGDHVTATASSSHGFWIPDLSSAGNRWYKRSDGSHQYIIGNTHYTFISGQDDNGSNGSTIVADVRDNADFVKKLRFGVANDRYAHPTIRTFFDGTGSGTNDGDWSHKPNPAWFQRVDTAVQTAFEEDLIADLILAGPDQATSRSTLRASANGGDNEPYLRYIAARYGSYPNVWVCLANEYSIKTPSYSDNAIIQAANTIKQYLPYPTPLSVHNDGDIQWDLDLNTNPDWNDHAIHQNKERDLSDAYDRQVETYNRSGVGNGAASNKPVVNDELAYQGAGDSFSEADTIEAHVGAFVGGGYGTTGEKFGNKLGQYFWGDFDPSEHTAMDNLLWLREQIDANITFWEMTPRTMGQSNVFSNANSGFRSLEWANNEYVLASDASDGSITATLPSGSWTVTQYNVINKSIDVLSTAASGSYNFSTPGSRAVMTHFQKNTAANNNLTVEVDGANQTLTGLAGYSGNQDEPGEGGLTVLPDGEGARLTGNTWKRYNFNYNVSSQTVIEVTLTVDAPGELVGIGFDNDDDHTNTFNGSPTVVVLDNTNQAVPNDMIDGTSLYGSGTQTVTIPIGQYYTGSVAYLCLVADDDRNPAQTDATFDNIRIYEQSGGGGDGDVAARVEIDPYNTNDWDFFTFRVTNNSLSASITSIQLSVNGGGVFDRFSNGSTFTHSPDLAGNNDGVNSANLTLSFSGSGLAAGQSDASDEGQNNNNDLDGSVTSIDVSVTFSDNSTLSGTMTNVGDTGDGDPDLWAIDLSGGGVSEISEAYVEAEDGSLGSEWGTFSDSGASGGQFIETTASSSTFSSPPGASGIATYNFTNLEAGNYELWGLVTMANGNQDSFWVRVDGGAWAKWNGVGDSNPASSWGWRQVFEQGGGNLVYTLSGNATVEIGYRETGAQLDQLFITKNGNTPQ